MVSTCSTRHPKGKKEKRETKIISIYLLFKFFHLGSSQHLLFGPSSKRLILIIEITSETNSQKKKKKDYFGNHDVAMAMQLIIIISCFFLMTKLLSLLLLLSVKEEQAIHAFHNQLKANFCLNYLLFAGIIEYFCLIQLYFK